MLSICRKYELLSKVVYAVVRIFENEFVSRPKSSSFYKLGKHFQLDFEMEIQFGYTRKASLKGNDFSNPQRIICDLFPNIGPQVDNPLFPPSTNYPHYRNVICIYFQINKE